MKHLPDVLMLAGAASSSFGAWMAWPPAGFLLAGALLLAGGIRLARSAA